jgi:hypothetical protein
MSSFQKMLVNTLFCQINEMLSLRLLIKYFIEIVLFGLILFRLIYFPQAVKELLSIDPTLVKSRNS